MNCKQARDVLCLIPLDERSRLEEAHERYMYFTGVHTDRPMVDHVEQDRAAFPHLLEFTSEGLPNLSDERCADFMVAITGLPRDWCLAWEEIAFVETHGEQFVGRQVRLRQSRETEANCARRTL
jgi:hypothetical protein